MAKRLIRPIRIVGNVAFVPLTRGLEAIIDATDSDIVCQHNWLATGHKHTPYARRRVILDGVAKELYLHRVIMRALPGLEIDHINGDGLDNRRCNLRQVTPAQNKCNTKIRRDNSSGLKGVSWQTERRKWKAQISINGKEYFLGRFMTKEEAFSAYSAANKKLHGEFGRLK